MMLAGERFFFLIENDELSKRCNFGSAARGILVPHPGMEPGLIPTHTLETQSLNH